MSNIIAMHNRYENINHRLGKLQMEHEAAITKLRDFRRRMLDLTYTKAVEDYYMSLVGTAEDITRDMHELLQAMLNSPLQN